MNSNFILKNPMKEAVLCKSSAVSRKFLREMKHTGFHLEMKTLT